MRISQDLAKQIASKLTEKSKAAYIAEQTAFKELVYETYMSRTPAEVRAVFEKHPDWVFSRQEVIINGHGFNYMRAMASKPVVCNEGSLNAHMPMTEKVGSILLSAWRKVEKAKEKYEKLKKETETALLNLKTTKQIAENLPAAIPFLPPPMSNSLVVNIDTLKRKLAAQQDVAEPLKVK